MNDSFSTHTFSIPNLISVKDDLERRLPPNDIHRLLPDAGRMRIGDTTFPVQKYDATPLGFRGYRIILCFKGNHFPFVMRLRNLIITRMCSLAYDRKQQ